jgi:hypothetical protein
MGLMIHSLGELPATAERGFYVYLLDYGWDDPMGHVVLDNFDHMSDEASRNNAVVIRGLVGSHFTDEVLSWHQVNGQSSKDILPALMVTTRNPQQFREGQFGENAPAPKDRMLLIPLRNVCKSQTDVAPLLKQLFTDIRDKKKLSNFAVAKELRAGARNAIVDALILQPNVAGLGVNVKRIVDFLSGRRQ